VQHLTLAGEYLGSFVVQNPIVIAIRNDIVAVGTDAGTIELQSLSTCELIRRIGSRGDGPGQIGFYATGIRFTPDGSCLLVAECKNQRLSLFTVDGVFLKHVGAGVLADGIKDVSFGAGGEIIVADCDNNRICVFSSDGDTLIKTWGSEGICCSAAFLMTTNTTVTGVVCCRCLYVQAHQLNLTRHGITLA